MKTRQQGLTLFCHSLRRRAGSKLITRTPEMKENTN